MGCGLMVRVIVLHSERSNSSDSTNKTRVIYVVLLIIVTWREIDEPTPKVPFFIQQKKYKKEKENIAYEK